jgi:hypothetical protein
MRIVINEWLLEDAYGTNGPDARLEAMKLAEQIALRNHVIVTLRPSKWIDKVFRLCGSQDYRASQLGSYFKSLLYNPKKCLIVDAELDFQLPNSLDRVKDDDHYLVEAYLKSEAGLLVTSDQPLINIFKSVDEPTISSIHRNEFLRSWDIKP